MRKWGIMLLTVCLLAGCGSGGGTVPTGTSEPFRLQEEVSDSQLKKEPGAEVLPAALNLTFSSGVGAWGTTIAVQKDGSFQGYYSDTDMGDNGKEYPYGTIYVCGFEGNFTDVEPLDENSYSLTLENLTSDYEEGKEWIEDGVRYVSSVPYGMEEGTRFVLYLPSAPAEGLDEEFLSWWPGRFESSETLKFYGLWNVEKGYGFFG